MAVATFASAPACAQRPQDYLDEQHHFPPARSDLTDREWSALSVRLETVRRDCASCPLLFDCLYRAVVEVDVFGYAACTTAKDREHIRGMLGIELRTDVDEPGPSRLDRARLGPSRLGPLRHDEVVTMRRTYPADTFGQLATRLGCSLSTIKRHLRRARDETAPDDRPARHAPTVEEVLDCFERLDASRLD